jgi:hypothetical protein
MWVFWFQYSSRINSNRRLGREKVKKGLSNCRHYPWNAFAINQAYPTIIPKARKMYIGLRYVNIVVSDGDRPKPHFVLCLQSSDHDPQFEFVIGQKVIEPTRYSAIEQTVPMRSSQTVGKPDGRLFRNLAGLAQTV